MLAEEKEGGESESYAGTNIQHPAGQPEEAAFFFVCLSLSGREKVVPCLV